MAPSSRLTDDGLPKPSATFEMENRPAVARLALALATRVPAASLGYSVGEADRGAPTVGAMSISVTIERTRRR